MSDQAPTSPVGTESLQTQLQALAERCTRLSNHDSETRDASLRSWKRRRSAEATPARQGLTHLRNVRTCSKPPEQEKQEMPRSAADLKSRARRATQFPNVAAMARTLVDALANIGISAAFNRICHPRSNASLILNRNEQKSLGFYSFRAPWARGSSGTPRRYILDKEDDGAGRSPRELTTKARSVPPAQVKRDGR